MTGTYVGSYQPYLYLPVGVAMRQAGRPVAALRVGRVACAVLALLILLPAVVLWWRSEAPAAVLGFTLALTPTVLFDTSVLGASGAEIAAAATLAALSIRLVDHPESPPALWLLAGVAGAVLGCVRPLGGMWLIFMLLGVVVMRGPRAILAAVRRGRGAAAAAIALIVAGALAGGLWQALEQPSPQGLDAGVAQVVRQALGDVDLALRQAIGGLVAPDISVGKVGLVLWAALLAAWVAVRVAGARSRRDRARLAGLGILAGATIALIGVLLQTTGGQTQGRYVLPAFVAALVWAAAGEARAGRWTARLVAAGALVTAAIHFATWWSAARRAAHESGLLWFLHAGTWAPPAGWTPWFVLALIGAAAWAAAGLLLLVERPDDGA